MNDSFCNDSYDRLQNRIDRIVEDRLVEDRSQALIYLILTHRFYREPFEIKEAFTDGGNDLGVDAVFIDRKGDEPAIHIFQSKVHQSKKRASQAFGCSVIESIIRFFSVLRDTKTDLAKIVNPALEQKILEIREAVQSDFPTFKLWLVSNGSPCVPHELNSHLSALKKVDEVEVEEFHLNEIVEFCLNAHSSRTNHHFFAREVGVIEAGNSELRSAVGYISAQELYSLIKDIRDERKVDYTVFNLNVRGFLGLDNPVNKEIVRTATSSRNVHFASLNNGITIVGSTLRVHTTGTDRPKVGIKRMSIVNGAQTCHSIFEAMKDYYPNFEIFRGLSVLFRIFETDDPKLISDISISTNNQNRISPRDLRANDEFQVRLEAELKEYGVIYQRKRHLSTDDDGEAGLEALDALKAGQIILSYIEMDPARAKRDSDSIFTDFYGKLFGRVDVSKLIEGFEWLKAIEKQKSFIEDEVRIRGARRTENTFVTYGVFHILMMCGILQPKATNDERSEVIEKAINVIANHLVEVGEPAYYSYFRDTRFAGELARRATEPRLL